MLPLQSGKADGLPPWQRGIALIEAMVSTVIFTVGILGLVGLQTRMAQAQHAAQLREVAALLASERIASLWLESGASPDIDIEIGALDTSCSSACVQWMRKVHSRLPAGAALVARNPANGEVDITITWNVPAEGMHRYATHTAIP